MPIEAVTHISDLVATNPVGSTDKVQTLDDHIRNIKTALLNDFATITGPITASVAEINILDGATLSTAELNLLDGVTASTAELNILDGVTLTAAQINDAARQAAANVFTNALNRFGNELRLNSASGVMSFFNAANSTRLGYLWHDSTALSIVNEVSGGAMVFATAGGGAISFNGVTVADIARLSAANAFTQSGGGQNAALRVTAAQPSFVLNETGAAADNRKWQLDLNATTFRGLMINDADSLAATWLVVSRSGNTATSIAFAATTLATGATLLTTSAANANEPGFRGMPIATKTADYSIVADDAGRCIIATSACDQVTFTSGCLAAGMSVMVANGLGGNLTLVESGVNLYLTGTGTSANRTVSTNGFATVFCTDGATTFLVQGPGVS